MSTERDELRDLMIEANRTGDPSTSLCIEEHYATVVLAAGYRKIFDGGCGLSNVKDPDFREAAEAWMRWANLAMNDEIGSIGAMKQMLTEFGYRKVRP